MASLEILTAKRTSAAAGAMLQAVSLAASADHRVVRSERYIGHSGWLMLFGVGAALHNEARRAQLKSGGRALLWDLGYFGDRKRALRMSIDTDHPQRWLDRTPADGERWERLGIALRDEADPLGPVILVGLGQKSRAYLRAPNWEREQLKRLRALYPRRGVVYRPKPGQEHPVLDCDIDSETPIGELLRGASLVVCRHSNVGVNAVVAGVPLETEDGAAAWLAGRSYTRETRLDFLRRLAWWQWEPHEAAEAWQFARRIVS